MFEFMITDIAPQITEWRALVLLGVISLTGFGRLIQKYCRIKNATSLGAQVYKKYIILCENIHEGEDHFGAKKRESIDWLMMNTHRIKTQMGSGYYGSYRPMNDVWIILKGLPKVERYLLLNRNGEYSKKLAMLVLEINGAFSRYIGALEHEGSLHVKKMKNPFLSLREGVAWMLSLLLLLLSLLLSPFGVLRAAKIERIMAGSWIRSASGLISFVASLITIILFMAS